MKCPNCGNEVVPDEVFCGTCGTRMAPVEPPPVIPTVPVTPAKKGGLPIVPIVIGAVILLVAACLCLLVAGLAGLCALPFAVPGISTAVPTKAVFTTPRPTQVVVKATPTVGLPGKSPAVPTPAKSPIPPTASSGASGSWTMSYVYRTNALSGSSVEIMGEAVNTSSQEVNTGWVEVLVTLKDKNGDVVPATKELTTRLQRPIVLPGQKSCFRYFFDAKTYGFDLAKVDKMEAEIRKAADGRDAYTVELSISNVKRAGSDISGDITNDTEFTTRSIFILVSLYDSSGKITGVHYGDRVGDEKMAPGGTMGFTYNVISSDVADSFEVLVIAYKE